MDILGRISLEKKEMHWNIFGPQQRSYRLVAFPGKYQNTKQEMATLLQLSPTGNGGVDVSIWIKNSRIYSAYQSINQLYKKWKNVRAFSSDIMYVIISHLTRPVPIRSMYIVVA